MMAKQRRRMLTRVLLGILLIFNSASLLAQQEESAEAILLPVEDPFLVHSRINFVYNNSVAEGQEGTQQLLINPVLGLDEHSTLQFSTAMVWYQPGNTGNLYGQGFGDFFMQYFRRFETSQNTSHGLAVNVAFDTAANNLGGGATTLGGGYGFEFKPDDDNKLVAIVGYSHSMGQTTPGDPTRSLAVRFQGYHYFDSAYAGLELRNQFNLFSGAYQPFAIFSVGGEVVDGLQLWGSFRLPLNAQARDNNDRINYSIGITLPL